MNPEKLEIVVKLSENHSLNLTLGNMICDGILCTECPVKKECGDILSFDNRVFSKDIEYLKTNFPEILI